MPIDRSNDDLFQASGIEAVSDALDIIGVNGGLAGIHRQSGSGIVVGPAFTVRMEKVEPGSPGLAADYIDDVPPGSVVVIDNGGRRNCTVFGGILAQAAQRRGIRGIVIYGANRDTGELRRTEYPVWSCGPYMKSGKNRVRLAEANVPISIGNVTVSPGDIVVADDSGVLVVPAADVDVVARYAEEVQAIEGRIRAEIASGSPLSVARKKHGYNHAPPNEDRRATWY